MKVVLKKRVPTLGFELDVVTVKRGYAQNFLIPQGFADMATPSLIKMAEKHVQTRAKKMEEMLANAKEVVQKMEGITLHFKKKARGEKLYGSIAEKDIADALTKDHGLEINKEMVKMEHLKTVGEHKVVIHLTEGVEATVAVKVEAE